MELVEKLIEDCNGTVKEIGMLLDGSGFATASFPLPKDHWSVADPEKFNVPPMPFRIADNAKLRQEWKEKIQAAGKYAYRASTMNGKCADLDPDALIQNLVVGMIGYFTSDGLSHSDSWANPEPIPPAIS